MAEKLIIDSHKTKIEQYEQLHPQIVALTAGETDLIANLSNISAALHQTFGWFWVGFYLVKNDNLVLGPFQGTIACTRIPFGKGVCGAAWELKQSILVPEVDKFPGHIACSSLTVSEIVIPVFNVQSEVVATLDIDSDKFGVLDEIDVIHLERLAKHIGQVIMK